MQTPNFRYLVLIATLLARAGLYAASGEPLGGGTARWPAADDVYMVEPWSVGSQAIEDNTNHAGVVTHLVTRVFRSPNGGAASLTVLSNQAPKLYGAGAEVPFLGSGYTVQPARADLDPGVDDGVGALVAQRGTEQWLVMYAYGERRGLGAHAVPAHRGLVRSVTQEDPVQLLPPADAASPGSSRVCDVRRERRHGVMAIRLWRWTSLATVTLLAIGASVACGPITLPVLQSGGDSGGAASVTQPASGPAQSAASATATPARARPGALRTVPVTRDSLTETLTLDGVASALAQEPIAYGWRAAVDDVKVKPSQSVKKGDILVDFNPGDAPKNLDTARGRLQTAQANLVQAQAQADSRQASATQKAAADQQQQQQIILDAELQLKKAQDNLVAVRSGNGAPKIGEMTDLASQETGPCHRSGSCQRTDRAYQGPNRPGHVDARCRSGVTAHRAERATAGPDPTSNCTDHKD